MRWLALLLMATLGATEVVAQSAAVALEMRGNYVFRGLRERAGLAPTVALDLRHADGGLVGIWGGLAGNGPGRAQLDLVAGWSGSPAPKWTAEAWLTGTMDEREGVNEAIELHLGLARGPWKATFDVAPTSSSASRSGLHLAVDRRVQLGSAWRLRARLGAQVGEHRRGADYRYLDLRASRSLGPVDLWLAVAGADPSPELPTVTFAVGLVWRIDHRWP